MPTPNRTAILISAMPGSPREDVASIVREAGFAFVEHSLGSIPTVNFDVLAAAIICVGESVDRAIVQTARWRVELGDRYSPIVWILDGTNSAISLNALTNGADLCLARPLEEEVVRAQLLALMRVHRIVDEARESNVAARTLSEQLQTAFARFESLTEFGIAVARATVPRTLPSGPTFRIGVHHGSTTPCFDVRQSSDEVELLWGTPIGAGGLADGILTLFLKTLVNAADRRGPGEIVSRINRSLLELKLDDGTLVALASIRFNVTTGEIAFARGGLPAPYHVAADGTITRWESAGNYLGLTDADYSTVTNRLKPGEKLLFSIGVVPGFEARIASHRLLPAQTFVEAIADSSSALLAIERMDHLP